VKDSFENISLQFSDDGLVAMNISLAVIMFAVALSMNYGDFAELKKHPKSILSGLISQWLILPLITLLLIYLIQPHPLLGLGMILVSVCPGGNVSNFFSMMAGGNVALSVVLTSFSSLFATILTPLGYVFWISLSPYGEQSAEFQLSFSELAGTLVLILLFPLVLGWMVKTYLPKLAEKLAKPAKFIGVAILALFIGVAIWNNRFAFAEHLDKVFLIVLGHNALALGSAWIWARLAGNPMKESITITLETGIQNSGLALIIIFGFFNGNGGMALMAAWWGVWHLIAGFSLSQYFSYRNKKSAVTTVV